MTGLNNLSNNIQLTTSNSSGWVLKVNNNGKDYNDEFHGVARSTENGVSYIYSVGKVHNGSNYDAFIMKTTLDGSVVWQKRLGGSDNEVFYDVNVSLEGSDFYVYAVGIEFSNNGDSEALIVKFDSSGNLVWQRKLEGSGSGYFHGVSTSLEGSNTYVYAAGYEYSGIGSNSEALIIKFDSSGNLVWQKRLEGSNGDYFYGVTTSIEGSTTYVYAVGYEFSSDDNPEALIAKFDSSGNLVWQKRLEESNGGYFHGVSISIEDSNTYVYAAGYEYSSTGNSEALIAKFDASGNLVWQKRLEGSSDNYFNGVATSLEDSNSYVYAVGHENSSEGGDNALIAKFDSSGNLVWQRKLEGSKDYRFYGVTVSLENYNTCIYTVGFENSSDDNSEALIAKLDASGNLV